MILLKDLFKPNECTITRFLTWDFLLYKCNQFGVLCHGFFKFTRNLWEKKKAKKKKLILSGHCCWFSIKMSLRKSWARGVTGRVGGRMEGTQGDANLGWSYWALGLTATPGLGDKVTDEVVKGWLWSGYGERKVSIVWHLSVFLSLFHLHAQCSLRESASFLFL